MSTTRSKRAGLGLVIGTLLIFGGCKLPDSYTVVSTPTFSPPGGTYDSA